MKKHSRYYYSLLISCLIIMSSCQPKPSSLLKEAMKMEKVSTDSIFFYLQQIAHPRNYPYPNKETIICSLIKQRYGKPASPVTHCSEMLSRATNKATYKPNGYKHT